MTTARKHYTAQDKVAILRLHLLEQRAAPQGVGGGFGGWFNSGMWRRASGS